LSDRFCANRFVEKHCRAALSAADSRNGVSPKRPPILGKTFPHQIRTGALVLAWFGLAQIASADWQIASVDREPSPVAGVEHRHIVLQNSGESATIDLAAFSTKNATLRVIDNPSGSENLGDEMEREIFIAGVNGGYFDTQFRPLGLRMIDGTMRSPFIRGRLLTGVFCASSRGIEVIRVREFSQKKKCDAAIECGPFLIDGGMPVRGLDQARRARRTFVALTRTGNVTIGVSSELSLAELASVLSAFPDFKVWRALNLDGGSSSAFWFRRRDGSAFSIPEEKSVRDFVGIVPR
jgi:Phosphodiester glycosidase